MSYILTSPVNILESSSSILADIDGASTKTLTFDNSITAGSDCIISLNNPGSGRIIQATSGTVGSFQRPLDVQYNSSSLNAQNFSTIDFSGTGVTATDAGSGVASVAISTAASTPATHGVYWHEVSSGTAGGTSVTTTWTNRTLNTAGSNNNISGASLASNLITLPNGRYFFHVIAPTYNSGATRTRVYNNTSASVALEGVNVSTPTNGALNSSCIVQGIVVVSGGNKDFKIQTNVANGFATSGLGKSSGFASTNEIYTIVAITRVASS